jgi:hypothetical protein
MKLEKLLKQTIQHQHSLAWAYSQSDIIADKIIALEKKKKFDIKKYNTLSKNLLELQTRYMREQKEFTKTKKDISKYFKIKYGFDIVAILEDNAEAK